MNTRKTRKNSHKEVWMHWTAGKPVWEVPMEEREKYIHACVMTYTDSTRKQYFAWGGKWHGLRPVCFCGHHFEDHEIMEVEDYEEWKKSIMKPAKIDMKKNIGNDKI